jgi:hypothetical protein
MTPTILALDLGLTTGWACLSPGGHIFSGTWKLKPSRFDSRGAAFLRFEALLQGAIGEPGASPKAGVVIAVEAVRRHKGTDAAHIYGALLGIVLKVCEEHQIEHIGISVAAIKREATGKGGGAGTGKQDMLAAAALRWPDERMADDNEADARFVALAAARELGGVQ